MLLLLLQRPVLLHLTFLLFLKQYDLARSLVVDRLPQQAVPVQT